MRSKSKGRITPHSLSLLLAGVVCGERCSHLFKPSRTRWHVVSCAMVAYMHDEPYITIGQAARECPGNPHPSTVWRWASKGVAVGDRRVRLRAGKQGRRTVTKRSWLDEFTQACARPESASVHIHPNVDAQCEQEGI